MRFTEAGEEMQKKDFFYEYLAKELQLSKEEILDFDLYLYNTEMPETVGMGKELISAPRLDNLTSLALYWKCVRELCILLNHFY